MSQNQSNLYEDPQLLQTFIPKVTDWCQEAAKPASYQFHNLPGILPFKEFKLLLQKVQTEEEETIVPCSQLQSQQLNSEQDVKIKQLKQQLVSEDTKKLISSEIALNLFGLLEKQRKHDRSDSTNITPLFHCRSSNVSCHQSSNDDHEQNLNQEKPSSQIISNKNEDNMIQIDESRFRVKPKERHVLRWSSEGKGDIRVRLVDPDDFLCNQLQLSNNANYVGNHFSMKTQNTQYDTPSFHGIDTNPPQAPANGVLLDGIPRKQIILPQSCINEVGELSQQSKDTNNNGFSLILENQNHSLRHHKDLFRLNQNDQGNNKVNQAKLIKSQQPSEVIEKQYLVQIHLETRKKEEQEVSEIQPQIQCINKTNNNEATNNINAVSMTTFNTSSLENSKRRDSSLADNNNNFDETKDTTAIEVSNQRIQLDNENVSLDNTAGDIQATDQKKKEVREIKYHQIKGYYQEEEQEQKSVKQEDILVQNRMQIVNEKEQQAKKSVLEKCKAQDSDFKVKTEDTDTIEIKMQHKGEINIENEVTTKEQGKAQQKIDQSRNETEIVQTEEILIYNKGEQTQYENPPRDKTNIFYARDQRVEKDLFADHQKELLEHSQNDRELKENTETVMDGQKEQEFQLKTQLNTNRDGFGAQDSEQWISPTQERNEQKKLLQKYDKIVMNTSDGERTTDIDSYQKTTTCKDSLNSQTIPPNTTVTAFYCKNLIPSAEKIQNTSKKQDLKLGYSIRKECSKIFLPQKGNLIEPEELSLQLLDQISASIASMDSSSHGIALSSEIFADDRKNSLQKLRTIVIQDNKEDKGCEDNNIRKDIPREEVKDTQAQQCSKTLMEKYQQTMQPNIFPIPSLEQELAASQNERIVQEKEVQRNNGQQQQYQSLTERSFLKKPNKIEAETGVLRTERIMKKEGIQLELNKRLEDNIVQKQHHRLEKKEEFEYETARNYHTSQISSNRQIVISSQVTQKLEPPSIFLQFKDNDAQQKIEVTEEKLKTPIIKQKESHHSSLQKLVNSKNHFYQQQQAVMLQFNQHLLPQTQTNKKKALLSNHKQNQLLFQENCNGDNDKFQTPSKKQNQQINNSRHLDLVKDKISSKQNSQQSNSHSGSSILRQNGISTALPSPCLKDNNNSQTARSQQFSIQSQGASYPHSLYFYPQQNNQKLNHLTSIYPSGSKDISKQQPESEYYQSRQIKSPHQQQHSKLQQLSSSPNSSLLVKKLGRCNSQDQMSQQDGKALSSAQHNHPHHHRSNLSDSINFVVMNKQSAPYSMKTKANDRAQLFKKAVEYNLQVLSQNSGQLQDLELIYQKSILNTRQKSIVSCDQGSVYCHGKIKEAYQHQ